MKMFLFSLWLFFILACQNKNHGSQAPSTPSKSAQSIGEALDPDSLGLKLTKLNPQKASIEILNLKDENGLECFQNGERLSTCSKNYQVDLLPGNNVFEVYKRVDSKLTGFADLLVQNGFDSSNLPGWSESLRSKDPLLLIPSQSSYQDGLPQDRAKDFVFEFKLAKPNDCNPVYRCSYDQREALIWRPCSEPTRHVIPSEILAKGLQFLHVRAECPGKVGPTLSVHFYGVQKDYTWLNLDRFRIASTNEDIFLLEKSNDCPESLLKFECISDINTANFVTCKNRQSKISSSFKIRAVCDSKPGPVHVML